MKIQNEVIIIVGAYSTGQFLAPNFIARGYQCIHIQPGSQINPYFLSSYKPEYFIENVVWDDNDEEILHQLQDFKIKLILPGCEMAVLLADRLSMKLGLFTTNDFDLSNARRNKYLMHEALKSANLSHIKHYKSKNVSSILKWVQDEKIGYPVVIKPLASGGTDGVYICQNPNEIHNAFIQIHNKEDAFGGKNNEVLAQQYLNGSEYVINTVSYAGKHYITDIIKVHKKLIDNSPVYDYAELLSPKENQQLYLKFYDYITLVLDALGIKFGPGHSEVIMEENHLPVLVETAARPIGGIDPSAYTEALGYNQISVTVECYLNPNNFYKILLTQNDVLHKYLVCAFCISSVNGAIENKPNTEEIRKLQTLHSITLQDKGILKKTSTLIDCPGFINLLSSDREKLFNDYALIRKLENKIFSDMLKVKECIA